MLALKYGIIFPRTGVAGPCTDKVHHVIEQTFQRCEQECAAATNVVFIRAEGSIELLGARGYSEQTLASFASLPLSARFPLTDCIVERQPIWLGSQQEWERRYPVSISNAKTERKAWCAVPLCVGDHVIAALGLGWAKPLAFDDELKLRIAETASDCATALGKLPLHELF